MQTLSGFEKYGKPTRRAQFLAEVNQVVPLERMLRIHFLQL